MTQEIKGHDNPPVLIVDKGKKTRNRKPKEMNIDEMSIAIRKLSLEDRVILVKQLRSDIEKDVAAARDIAAKASELASGI